jgi:hypothetical protein
MSLIHLREVVAEKMFGILQKKVWNRIGEEGYDDYPN